MNDARRTLLALYSVLLMAGATGFIVMTWTQGKKLDLTIGGFNLEAFIEAGSVAKVVATTIMAAILWLGVCSLYIALRDYEGRARATGAIRGQSPDGAPVEYTPQALAALVGEDLELLPDVRSVRPVVLLRRGQPEMEVDAVIASGAAIGHVTGAISRAAEDSLRERTGVLLARRPIVRVRHDDREVAPMIRIPRPPPPPPGPYDDISKLEWPSWRSAPQRDVYPGGDER
jgi:hypothetical protein